MAVIHEELTLADKFSGVLDRYIQKLQTASTNADNNKSAMSGLTNAALRMATGLRNVVQQNQEAYQTEVQLSGATSNLVERLSSLENAMRSAYTDSEMESYLARLQQQMRQMGLVWTNSADQMEAADMIVRVGLRQLAAEGRLAASSTAEEAFQANQAAEAQEKHEKKINSVKNALSGLITKLTGVGKAQKSYEGLTKQFRRFGLTIFSVSRILNSFKSALERAPESIQSSWARAGSSISDLFAGTVVSALQAMQPAIDRLNTALNSDAGQKLARGLETLGNVAGQAIGFLLDKASQLVEFIGSNFQTIMTIAAVVLGLFAARMLASALATAVANAPLLLFIGLCAAVVVALMNMGVTAEEIFGAIGAAAGWLYALVYNLIADTWNVIAIFAEFFANVFNDPVAAVAHLFFDTFDAILGVVETVAGAIDFLLGTDMAGAVSGFRSKMQAWVNDTFGENKIKIDRMEKLDYNNTVSKFSSAASGLASSLSDFSLGNMAGVSLSDISSDTGSIAGNTASIEKSVNMADEDLKNLVDMAEREYVNNINLTAQTPVITVNGANTGRTQADRQALADSIRDILLEQAAAGATRSTARAYSGG